MRTGDPTNDPGALIANFLDGYYGAEAAPHMREYIDIVHESAKTQSRPVFSVFADGINAPFLTAGQIFDRNSRRFSTICR